MLKPLTAVGAAVAMILLIGGCSSGTVEAGDAATEPSIAPAEPEPSEPTPVTQEATCDWDTPRLASGAATVPASAGADLATALIGSWQHTHIDSGSGFEALAETTDIRYVFPSTTQLLYCQDVQGATSQAERSATIELDGTNIVLPSPSQGYTVTAWTDTTMLWTNNLDGSLYLLKRR